MAERIVLRVGEALVAGGPPGTAAEPEVVIGALDGPVGTAFATLMGDQVKGHTKVLAILNTDVMVRPATSERNRRAGTRSRSSFSTRVRAKVSPTMRGRSPRTSVSASGSSGTRLSPPGRPRVPRRTP